MDKIRSRFNLRELFRIILGDGIHIIFAMWLSSNFYFNQTNGELRALLIRRLVNPKTTKKNVFVAMYK